MTPASGERDDAGARTVGDSEDARGRLRVRGFTGGAFGENAYLLDCTATRKAALVDPGAAAPQMLRVVREEGLAVEAVYLTHAHLDHVEGLPTVRAAHDVPIHLHSADLFLYRRAAEQAAAFGMRLAGDLPEVDRELEPGTAIRVGRHELAVRFTPGHAPGHVIFHSEDGGFALVGDVVFAGSIGRTDLPGGDMQELLASIRREVLTLPDETRLLTGHGPETTVVRERRGNPFLVGQEPGTRA
jgi:hydroxyacylglutathione hydrolase